MVQNPIYEGPLYETLETQFNNVHTLTAATKNTSLDHSSNTAPYETPSSSNSSPTLRYVEQPQQTCVPQNISHTHDSPIEGHSTNIQCHPFQHLEQDHGSLLKLAAIPVDMEEKYIIMTQSNAAAIHEHAE